MSTSASLLLTSQKCEGTMSPLIDLAQATESDVYIHSGDLNPPSDESLIEQACRPRQARAYLFAATFGGYARVAYRMMRSLRHAYDHVTIVVAGPCKSAGTLLVLGADELVMTGTGELGPLDVQLLKDNELLERQSGLVVDYAFDRLNLEARTAFQKAFLDMKLGGRMTTATAADAAAKLVVGLMSPIFAQIDPIRVGEISMAHLVANRYAQALMRHGKADRAIVTEQAVLRLLSGYPSHDYVIDRQEAEELFSKVRAPNESERAAITQISGLLSTPARPACTIRCPITLERNNDLTPPASDPEGSNDTDQPSGDSDDGPAGPGKTSGADSARPTGGKRTSGKDRPSAKQ